MTFGTKYTYNPVPSHLGMLLVSAPNMGKTSFASKLRKYGKFGVVCDADGRFNEVVTDDINFVPLSDNPEDMIDPKQIHDTVHKSMPNKDVGMFLVDSLTPIIEPIVLRVQRDVEEGKSKGARGYKEKADAMKYLQAAFTPWGVDIIWVYHYREHGTTSGQMETVTTVTELELARLYRNINIKCEIVVDKKGMRGVKVLEARGGRVGMTIWDQSGTWENIRQRLEDEVWGGLTKVEQDQLLNKRETKITNQEQAISWAWEFSEENGNFFSDVVHVQNAYNKSKAEVEADYKERGEKLTGAKFFELWKLEVFKREEEGK